MVEEVTDDEYEYEDILCTITPKSNVSMMKKRTDVSNKAKACGHVLRDAFLKYTSTAVYSSDSN